MRNIIVYILIFALLLTNLVAIRYNVHSAETALSNPLSLEWEKIYSEQDVEYTYDMTQTIDGGYVLLAYTLLDGIWLIKTNATGHVEWDRTYPEGIYFTGNFVIQTHDGGYAITGFAGAGGYAQGGDFLLLKTDENGTAMWSRTYNEGKTEIAYSLVQTADGGYVLAGYKAAYPSGSDADGWLIKTDPNGGPQWNQTYGGPKGDFFYSVVQTSDGGYAVAGRHGGYYDIGDYWLVKANSAGVLQWNKTFGEVNGQDRANQLIQTDDDGLVIAGYSNWPSGDVLLVKTSSDGAAIWSKGFNSTGIGTSLSRRREGGFSIVIETGKWPENELLLRELNPDGNIQSEVVIFPLFSTVDISDVIVVQTDDGGYAFAGNEISAYPNKIDLYLMKLAGKDTDEDGLFDVWEQQGIDLNNDGKLEFDLKTLGVDWLRKDLFVEIDYMENHGPSINAINDVDSAFFFAPINNPNGVAGINLHVEIDEEIPHNDTIEVWDDFNNLKSKYFGKATERSSQNWAGVKEARRRIFRYCLFIHTFEGSASGIAEIPGNDFIVSLGNWTTVGGHGVGNRDEQAGTLMHELGHTLGLRHGGIDDVNAKPNYLSVMSYSRQFSNLVPDRKLDYSRQKLESLNESNLVETIGIQGPAGETTVFGPPVWNNVTGRWEAGVGTSQGPIDWNRNGLKNDTGFAISINDFTLDDFGDTSKTVLEGYNDWANIRLNFRNTTDYAEGVHTNVADEEITLEIAQKMQNGFVSSPSSPPVIPEFTSIMAISILILVLLVSAIAVKKRTSHFGK